jgi:signal transduction histidine kinase
MRWPIRIQLLLWILSVVVFGIVATTLVSVYLAAEATSREQLANLHQVVTTLSKAPRYPLSQTVLKYMSGLSGGEFVLMDSDGKVTLSTIPLDAPDLAVLRSVPARQGNDLFAQGIVVRLGGKQFVSDQTPLPGRMPGGKPEHLIILYPKHQWWSIARAEAVPVLIAGCVSMLLAMIVSVLVAGRFVHPIRVLRNQADQIADGRFQPVELPRHNDEIGDLTGSINRMTERLGRYEDEVRRHERLRVLGQLGAGIAHQLRNAATGARMAVELHRQETPASADDESLQIALRQLRLMESHVQRFLSLGRHEPSTHAPVTLQAVVDDALPLLRPACDHAGIDLRCHRPDEPVRVRGDAHWLGQLLTNLVLNAIEAAGRLSRPGGQIDLELDADESGHAVVRVQNNGPTPDAAIADRLFEPFVTDKPDGTGLGLYLVRQVAEDHGGTVRWERRNDATCFTVELPLDQGVS